VYCNDVGCIDCAKKIEWWRSRSIEMNMNTIKCGGKRVVAGFGAYLTNNDSLQKTTSPNNGVRNGDVLYLPVGNPRFLAFYACSSLCEKFY